MCGWCSPAAMSISRRNHSATDRGPDFGVEDFDCHRSVVLVVLGQVDRGHPAPTQHALDLVRAEAGPRRQRLRLLTFDPRHQRRGVGRDGLIEEVGGAFGCGEQALHLAAQCGVAGAGPLEERRPIGCLEVERQVHDAHYLIPSRQHAAFTVDHRSAQRDSPVHLEVSQPRALAQSRWTVRRVTPSTSAVSCSVSPPK